MFKNDQRMISAALLEVNKSFIEPTQKAFLYPYGSDEFSFEELRKAASIAGANLFREAEGEKRYYVDEKHSGHSALLPFLSPHAQAGSNEAKKRSGYEKIYYAGAASGIGGALGRGPVATPCPKKDPEGFNIVKKRLSLLGAGPKQNILNASAKIASILPKDLATPFKRTTDLLKQLLTQQSKTTTKDHVR